MNHLARNTNIDIKDPILSAVRLIAGTVVGLSQYGDNHPLAKKGVLDGIDQVEVNYLIRFEGNVFKEKIKQLFSDVKGHEKCEEYHDWIVQLDRVVAPVICLLENIKKIHNLSPAIPSSAHRSFIPSPMYVAEEHGSLPSTGYSLGQSLLDQKLEAIYNQEDGDSYENYIGD